MHGVVFHEQYVCVCVCVCVAMTDGSGDSDCFVAEPWKWEHARGPFGGAIVSQAMAAVGVNASCVPGDRDACVRCGDCYIGWGFTRLCATQCARTVDRKKALHSIHCHFLAPRAGPLAYGVTRLRDGGSFSTRTCTVKCASGVPVGFAVASFHVDEPSRLDHSVPMVCVWCGVRRAAHCHCMWWPVRTLGAASHVRTHQPAAAPPEELDSVETIVARLEADAHVSESVSGCAQAAAAGEAHCGGHPSRAALRLYRRVFLH